MIQPLALTIALAIAAPAVAAQPASDQQTAAPASEADRRLIGLYEAYADWADKEFGYFEDDEGERKPADYLARVDAASHLRRAEYIRTALDRLEAIPVAELSPQERVNAAVFRTILETALSDTRFREWEMPVNSDSNFWSYLHPRQGFETAEEYRRYIARMRQVPRYFDDHIANMRAGLKRGFSVPRETLEGRDESIAAFAAATPEESSFFDAFEDMPSTIPAAEQQRLRQEGAAAIREAVLPAYGNLLRFFRDDYLPKTRTSVSASELPQGDDYYRAEIREYTTLDLSPEEIHQIGLREVARINAEMRQVMRESGFAGSFEEFLTFLRTDPQFYAKTPEDLLKVSAWVAKRVDGKIGETIGHLPRRRFTIRAVPDEIAPFYTAGRGGLEACMMNTHNLPSRPLYNIPALTLHECSPGHSFQAALAEERKALPAFRRNIYFSGYGEGWGLYTEWLGVGMGIYRTPYEHFGRLSYEMWRAARLVIDTGLHRYGWSRQKAIDYLASHTALSKHEVETEIDRYISWPGQALSYKLGELTIRGLRAQAEAALGPRFDQRAFHDAILELGSVPLPVLEERIRLFIANAQQASPRQ